jgi:hypothetical protein
MSVINYTTVFSSLVTCHFFSGGRTVAKTYG